MKYCLIVLSLLSFIITGCTPTENPIPSQTPTVEITAMVQAPTRIPPTALQISPHPQETATETASPTSTIQPVKGGIAFLGYDGNLYLIDPGTGQTQAITQDAHAPVQNDSLPMVTFCCSRWSTDGLYLAYQRSDGQPISSGYSVQNSLWVYDISTGQNQKVVDGQEISGFAWKPYTHLIAYSLNVPAEYFITRGNHNPELAQGIWWVNIDTNEKNEYIPPSRGYSLVGVQWSADGQYLGFSEVIAMEGAGNFAYYDLEGAQYHAFEHPIGQYAWLTKTKRIAYDTLTYAPNGTEKIWTCDLSGMDEKLLTTSIQDGFYASGPQVSPNEDLLAYYVTNLETNVSTLYVQPIQGGEPVKLHDFNEVSYTGWSPDSGELVVTTGPYDQREVVIVQVTDGSVKTIAKGGDAAWQPDRIQ